MFSLTTIWLAAAIAMHAAPPSTSQPASQPTSQPSVVTEQATIAGEEFTLEVAANEDARQKGLMGRDSIKDHGGMIFIWPAADTRSFWMKNCSIDIDILFLDSIGRIVAVHAMTAEQPQKAGETNEDYESRMKFYPSNRAAQYAVELKAGTIKRLKLAAGQMVTLDRRSCVQHLSPATSRPESSRDD